MKNILLLIFICFSLNINAQTKEEKLKMLKERAYEIDSKLPEIIIKNRWQLISVWDKKTMGDSIKEISYPNMLKFENKKYFRIYPNNININDSGNYLVDENYIILYRKSKENTYYNTINVFENYKYLVVESCELKGRKHNKLRNTTYRLLFKSIE
jgi:hypothetical protein